MQVARNNKETVLLAPQRLVATTRSDFRAAAMAHLETLPPDGGPLVIDMGHTEDLDASGLGVLVLVQKRAKERGLSTVLQRTPERVRNLLKLTMLDFLFELMD